MKILCSTCVHFGCCRKRKFRAIYPNELTPEVVRGTREFTVFLTTERGFSDADWPEALVDWYRDFDGDFSGRDENPLYLDTEVLFRHDRQATLLPAETLSRMDRSDPEDFGETDEPVHWRTWYRDNLMRPAGKRVRIDNAPRWAVVINILRAAFPAPEATCAANDNLRSPSNDN